jgi:hypothetical protein
MKTAAAVIVLLVLGGCESERFKDAEPFVRSTSPTQPASDAAGPPNLSPAAKAAAAPAVSNGGLMECVTNSCKINCSINVPAAARPKWCAYFKEAS